MLPQLRRQLFAQSNRLLEVASGFAPAGGTVAKRRGPQANLISDDFGISGDGTLASATHCPEKSALGRHALARVEVIQPLADDGDPFIVRPDFDSQSPLSDARQHDFGFQNRGQQTVRHSVSLQPSFGCHTKAQALKSRRRQNDRVDTWADAEEHLIARRHAEFTKGVAQRRGATGQFGIPNRGT